MHTVQLVPETIAESVALFLYEIRTLIACPDTPCWPYVRFLGMLDAGNSSDELIFLFLMR